VRLFARLFRLVWGTEVDRALRPVLAVSLAGSVAGSAVFPFLGIWALKQLGASQVELSLAFLVGATLAGVAGYAGGHLSDRIGRRPLILAGWAGQAVVAPLLILAGHHAVLGLVLLALLPLTGAVGGAADQAMVADLVPPERHDAAYAAVRVASNLGVSIGPPLGGLLLLGNSWPRLFVGAFVLSALGWAIAYRYIPRRGTYAPEEPPTRGSWPVIRRDYAFLLFMGSAMLATMTYVAFETLLPISVTTAHHIAPSTWGFLVVVNPILVTLVQLRLTRAVARVPASVKLGIAMPLMGLPFLLLNVNAAIPVVALVVFVFVIGEMLWVPTSQSVVAAFAPADIRGAYMGVFGGSWAVGWALTPFLGLQARHAFGDAVMWTGVAAISVVAGITGAAAARGRDREAAEAAVASAA
jgi:predicted MFS family arabinose efflux permease